MVNGPQQQFGYFLALCLIASVTASSSSVAYFVQQYWYGSDVSLCTGGASFINVYRLNTCFQQSSDTYVYYTYTNTSSTDFTLTLRSYSDSACTSQVGSAASGSYSSTCSTASGTTTTLSAYVTKSVPDFSDYSGAQTTLVQRLHECGIYNSVAD
jgi:hypothetical protein